MKHQPVKKFGGKNRIRICGRNTRCFMGNRPIALIKTFCMINIPATFFNAAIAPASLWPDNNRYIILGLGVILQLLTNIFLFKVSSTDPGIIPATFISEDAKPHVHKNYTNILFKEDRIKYLMF